MKSTVLALLISLIFFSFSFAQGDSEPIAQELRDRLKTDSFRVGVLLQNQLDVALQDDGFLGGSKFDLGATRLDIRGIVDQGFTYRFQVDFRRQVSIMDAQVGYRASDSFRVVAGAFKPFLSIDLDPGPGDTHFISRARQVGAMMNSREIGVTFLGDTEFFNYRLGIYNGTALTRQNNDRFLYTLRLGFNLLNDENNHLEVGINGAYDENNGWRMGNTGLTQTSDRVLYGGFLRYDGGGVFGAAEFLQNRFDALELGNQEETTTGFFATLGFRPTSKNEVLARWDHLSFDVRGDSSELLTLGWNHQATSLISFQVNVIAQLNDDMDDQFGLSGLIQYQF